jgi:ElaB/YqjD/DUF883 family membrane-anchored ribosome-binding protein
MATTHDPLATPLDKSPTTSMTQETTEDMKHRLSGTANQVRDKASELGRSAKESIDRNFRNAAGAIEHAASAIRSRMPEREGKVGGIANTTADKLDSTARYMREHSASDLYHGLEDWARRSPGMAIGGAAAVGLLLGMTLKRGRGHRY